MPLLHMRPLGSNFESYLMLQRPRVHDVVSCTGAQQALAKSGPAVDNS